MASREQIAKAIALLVAEFPEMKSSDGQKAISKERFEMWVAGLSGFDDSVVTKAVQDFICTSRFKPHLADIVERCTSQLDGQWIAADEAWSRLAKSESESCVHTQESAEAWAVAEPIYTARDTNGARMAFRECYNRLVSKAKLEGRGPVYFASLGIDNSGRIKALVGAIQARQMELDYVLDIMPEHATQILEMSGVKNHPLLAGPTDEGKKKLKELMATLRIGA